MVMVALVLLMGVMTVTFTTLFKSWGDRLTSLDIQEDLRQGLEKMMRDLRLATAMTSSNDAIRYTVREGGTTANYIFYLYHPSDSWPPLYNQTAYQLRKATLSGGINGTFTYGSGALYMKEVKPPPVSDLSSLGTVATMDLTVSKYGETFHLLQRIRPRNL